MDNIESRDLQIGDLVELEKQSLFSLDNLRHIPRFLETTFEDDKGLLGSVIVTRTTELAAVLANRSLRDKVRTLRAMEEFVYREIVRNGYRDLHAFVTDPTFANIMVQHFDFQYCKGRALVRKA